MPKPKKEVATESLDDVIINLQKTFSRVSETSASVPENQARALVTGVVNFEISTQVNSEGGHLVVSSTGDIQLTLKGSLETDIEEVFE